MLFLSFLSLISRLCMLCVDRGICKNIIVSSYLLLLLLTFYLHFTSPCLDAPLCNKEKYVAQINRFHRIELPCTVQCVELNLANGLKFKISFDIPEVIIIVNNPTLDGLWHRCHTLKIFKHYLVSLVPSTAKTQKMFQNFNCT